MSHPRERFKKVKSKKLKANEMPDKIAGLNLCEFDKMMECVGKKVSYERVMSSSSGRAGKSGANASAGSAGSAGSTGDTGSAGRQSARHIRVLVWNRFNNFD